jgi:hypothetical protein
MKYKFKAIVGLTFGIAGMFFFTQCTQAPAEKAETDSLAMAKSSFAGYESKEKWGEHLVYIGGCGDCHTPKKMTDHGPVQDSSLNLSGHPAGMPPAPVDRKDLEKKGVISTQTLTAWTGPWGTSYTANLTSDPTGIGGWTEENFFTAIRHGKSKGIETNRMLLPPMPWESIRLMTDDELRAVFAYLKSTKPVKNVVPQPEPPASAPSNPLSVR